MRLSEGGPGEGARDHTGDEAGLLGSAWSTCAEGVAMSFARDMGGCEGGAICVFEDL